MSYMRRIGSLTRRLPSLQTKTPTLTAAFSAPPNPKPPPPDPATRENPGSQAYQRALKTQRPPAIRWNPSMVNSVSFIGTVDRPLNRYNTQTTGLFGAYTLLRAKTRCGFAGRPLRILVELWEDMARRCMEHLKQDDCVYVSGILGSYTYSGEDGVTKLRYKIIVRELCYVAQSSQVEMELRSQDSQVKASGKSEESQTVGGGCYANAMEKEKDRLDLWKKVFADPHEWWDNRAVKTRMTNDSLPDFEHRRSHECLWLRPDDPPWIRSRLQLLDSRRTGRSLMECKVENGQGMEENRLYLWQMFFSSPREWWDMRQTKRNPRGPDFKHKHTGEALWLDAYDPPWIRSQLELLDSRRKGRSQMEYEVENGQGMEENRLYLLQVFFSSPREWWDMRQTKRNARAPDFKHKHTGEALWLNADDPPWVKRQLQLIDSRRQNDNANVWLSQFVERD